jgi:TolA-binding protein
LSLRRLAIPAALAALVVGGAIGAAVSYLAPRQSSVGHVPRSMSSAVSPSARRTAGSVATQRRRARSSAARPREPLAAGGSVTAGHRLNDTGYALIQRGDYAGAIRVLRRAVVDLRGAGPVDPYEAYANYNLGYALLATGLCTDALPPLGVARRLETSPLVGVAIRRARACAAPGS